MVKLVDLMKTFKGKVTLSDIRNEFKKVVDTINELITIINSLGDVSQYDLSKTSDSLSSPNYTLSLGGLKKILNEYYSQDQASWVVKPICIKLDNGDVKYFPGLLNVPNVGIIQTKQTILTSPTQDSNVYVDTVTKTLNLSSGILVDKLTNITDDTNMVKNNFIDISTTLKTNLVPDEIPVIKMKPITYTFGTGIGNVDNSSNPMFILPHAGHRASYGNVSLKGITIFECGGDVGGDRSKRSESFYAPIWIPKGVDPQIAGTQNRTQVLRFNVEKEE